MGIHFDILTDFLNEASEFSKFFTGTEPLKKIHDELKISHDTKLMLSPTDNRHELWDALRAGKGIFASIHKSDIIKNSATNLLGMIKQLQVPPNRARSYNEIRDTIKRIALLSKNNRITAPDFKKIKARLEGSNDAPGKTSIVTLAHNLYPENTELREAIHLFAAALRPGNYVLVKRLSAYDTPETRGLQEPDERKFPLRATDNKKEKIFGQEYTAWFFNGDTLIDKKRYHVNAVTVYRDLFPGWGDRDFYIIENEQFLKTNKHAFVPSKDIKFVEILPIERDSVDNFVKSTIEKYKRLVDTKIKEMSLSYGPEETHPEYQNAKQSLEKMFNEIVPNTMFKSFMTTDTNIQLDDYLIITTDRPFKSLDPYSTTTASYSFNQVESTPEDWETHTKESGKDHINQLMRQTGTDLPQKTPETVRIRSKADRSNVIQATADRINDPQNYEMWDSDRRRWVPYDPKYIGKFGRPHYTQFVAIAFKNIRDYNNFARRFMRFAVRSTIKAPELKAIEAMLEEI